MQTHHRIGEYLVGLVAGYFMYNVNVSGRSLKFNKFATLACWLLSISFMIFHVFLDPKSNFNEKNQQIYDSISKETWACSICWIIFACQYLKSGGFIRKFLSNNLWQPLSKMCLSIYLLHFLYIFMTVSDQKQLQVVEIWWQIHIHIGDVFISLILAAMFYILVEAPTANIIAIFWKKNNNITLNEKMEKIPYEKLQPNYSQRG
jgi:peptidoglycan/LPS O-acetylase OafA/YrhL